MVQETNKSPFIRHGYRNLTSLVTRFIQISKDGSMARWQDSIRMSLNKEFTKHGRWQEIRYTKTGRPYIMYARRFRKNREYLDDYLRC